MPRGEPLRQIEQLRRHRVRGGRDPSITRFVEAVQDQATRSHRKLGQLIDLWEQVIPPEIARRTALTGLRGGTAHVAVDSASTSYEVDRLLREGALGVLKRQFKGSLHRVRVRIAPDALRDRPRGR